QLISYGRMTVDKIAAIVSGTVMLSEGSEELWRCLIMTKEYDKKWITLLGQILPELGVEALIVYADTIKIDMSPEYGGLISHALGQIKPENVKKLQQAAGSVVYRRWKNYLNQVKDKKSGLHGIFISAYGELICGAVRHIYGEQEMWDQELSEEILQLERDMEGWYSDVMQMKTVFFVHMSQLCLLLCAAAELGLQPGKRCKEMIHRAKRLMEMQEYLWKDENQRVKLYGMLDKFSEMRC
ncbi:MAG: hypothetical protein Q4F76_08390, partial [Lachnospiraceae bacterium]|nr:hypothetical protein [Lachnospiraceae bacterium]